MSSMLYTVGLALDRAAQNGHSVEVLVDGHWLTGKVAAMDGTGLVLESPDGHHAVAKVERIAAVKIMSSSPYKASIAPGSERGSGAGPGSGSGPGSASGSDADARPMPGPAEAQGA